MAAPPPQQQSQTTAPPPQSDMSKDVNHWVDRANNTLKNPQVITDPQGSAPWHAGTFECLDPIDLCVVTWFCPCVTFGKTHHRLHKGDTASWSPINGSCLTWYLASCFGCQCIPTLMQRADIRERSSPKLVGNPIKDVLKAWCCVCCDLIQQDKEAQHLLATQSVEAVQPDAQPGMTYAQK